MSTTDTENKSDPNQPVRLGLGTLILIALIVLIFGGRGGGKKEQIENLQSDVQALAGEVRELRELIERESIEERGE